MSDAFFITNYLYSGGPSPQGPANVSGDCALDVNDQFYLVNYLNSAGPKPLPPNCPNSCSTSVAGNFAAILQSVPDDLIVGNVTASSSGSVRVPIYLRDNTGTLIGRDKPPSQRITRIALQVSYNGGACLNTIAPYVALDTGILKNVPATAVTTPHEAYATQSFTFMTSAKGGGIPFTSASTGDKIAELTFSLDGCAAGTVIPLTITTDAPAEPFLSCDSCTSHETAANGGIRITNGSISIQ